MGHANGLGINSLIKWARGRIAYLDAALIMAFVLNRTKTSVIAASDGEAVSAVEVGLFKGYVEQRALGKPLAYILGEQEFMGMAFEVNEHTLIPRPDTETLVEAALEIIQRENIKTVLELCTGSGCIAISLAAFCPFLEITATDVSAKALETAKKNALRHRVSINFFQADLFSIVYNSQYRTINTLPCGMIDPLECGIADHSQCRMIDPSQYGIIVANPPYIPRGEIGGLPGSVKDYEPFIALDGGPDGLDFYRAIIEKSTNCVALEIGYNQAGAVKLILEENKFMGIQVIKDLSGRDRAVVAWKNG